MYESTSVVRDFFLGKKNKKKDLWERKSLLSFRLEHTSEAALQSRQNSSKKSSENSTKYEDLLF